MKIRILFYVLLTAAVFGMNGFKANAQITFGVKAGSIFSTFQGNDASQNNTHQALTVGAFVNFGGTILSLQPEVLLTQKGATNVNETHQVREDFKINYVEVPLLFKFGLQLPGIYPHVYIGPYYAHALSQSYTYTDINGGTISQEYQQMKIRPNDIGAIGGAGIDFHINRLFFTIDGRYGLGMSTIDGGADYVRRDIRNGNFMLMGGIGIRLTE
ncbi:MAG TPA: porin family protein [Flavobacteriales bacterium]|nr:porin family protein [Flavobacteriales bacterium]